MGNKSSPGLLTVGSDRSSSRAREDYVKAIYQLGGGAPVRAAAVARYLNVSRVSVSKAKRQLESDGLLEVDPAPAKPLQLSGKGRALAIAMVRRHRLLETFLHRSLDLPLERVHAEAERIEHVISDDLALRIAAFLGQPSSDPHGHPIPYDDAPATGVALKTLASVAVGASARVVSLDDRDDEAVGKFAAAGVLPGITVRVERSDPAKVRVRCGEHVVSLHRRHAEMVRIAT
ncbi:MAG: metal-dependent transcriptional regulator [Candidatus Cybelea sp.]|jgi:DtxR family Mn-dependent transcriptional regulator